MSMQTLDLRIGACLQGEFSLARVNVLLAFQVNCPGCFLHALPVATALHTHFPDSDVQVLGLSTVFEDFSLNTEEHTRQLLRDGQVVGETAKHLKTTGTDRYDTEIAFPVAMDAIGEDGVGQTFAINRFPGTPTWIVFGADYTMHAAWFGHRDRTAVVRIIDEALSRSQPTGPAPDS